MTAELCGGAIGAGAARGRRERHAAPRQSVLGHAVPERRAGDAELLGGPDHVPAGDVQRRDELRPLEAVQRVREA